MDFAIFNPMAYLHLENWFGRGRKDHQPCAEPVGTMLHDLPIEVRVEIWKYLSIKDQKAIRMQCKQFQWEINKLVGVHAILVGPKPWKEWNFSDEKRCILAFANPETRRVQENVDWISNSVVRSLSLSQLSGMSFKPSTLISNGYVLHRFVVQFDHGIPNKENIMEMLNKCNNLRTIDVSCRPLDKTYLSAIRFRDSLAKYWPYWDEAIEFTQDIQRSLVSKPYLIQVSVRVEMLNMPNQFMGTPEEPSVEQAQYPSGIEKLNIQFPIRERGAGISVLKQWKVLLDQQTDLIELSVDLGLVHWTYFSNVIQKNETTLQKLSLSLGNWQVLRTAENWNNIVPEEDRLDWTALLPNPKRLTSLKVAMSSYSLRFDDLHPHDNINFHSLALDALETLELRSVRLDGPEMFKIFIQIRNLKKVSLTHWSSVGLQEPELTEIATTTFRWVFMSLFTGIQLESIVLKDLCIHFCPKYFRKLIDAVPNYQVNWPMYGCYKTYRTHQFLHVNELKITRNSLDQTIPPIVTRTF